MIFFKKRKNKNTIFLKTRKNNPKKEKKVFNPPKSKYFVFIPKKIFQTLIIPFLIVLMVVFFNSSIFRIKKMECYKTGFVCSLKEIEFFTSLIGKNIFFTSFDRYRKDLKQVNYKIKEIKIKKILPDKILIEIFPRTAAANLTSDQKTFFLADEEGFVFEEQNQPLPNVPIVLFNEVLPLATGISFKGKVENILELIFQLKKRPFNLSLIKLTGMDALTLTLDKEVMATFSARKNFSEQLDSLQLIISRSKIEGKLPEKIDLRFEKPIIIY